MTRTRGATLLELLVALAVGLLILGTITQSLAYSSRAFGRTEALADMQAQADLALRFLADDIRMAGHWGLAGAARHLDGRSVPGNVNPGGLPAPTRCAATFTLDLARAVTAARSIDGWGCDTRAVPESDSLVLRAAATHTRAAQPNRLQLIVQPGFGEIVSDGGALPGTTPARRHDLAVHGYYVAPSSTAFPDQPVLRRMTLSALTSRPILIDEEIAAGVESLQVAVSVDSNGDGLVDETLHAGDPRLSLADGDGLPLLKPVSVHVWVIVRSATAGWSESTQKTLVAGDVSVTPPADGRLRFVASQTVWIRNAAQHP